MAKSMACGTCRRTKVKCEGGIPCARCRRLRIEASCAQPPPKKRGRKRKIDLDDEPAVDDLSGGSSNTNQGNNASTEEKHDNTYKSGASYAVRIPRPQVMLMTSNFQHPPPAANFMSPPSAPMAAAMLASPFALIPLPQHNMHHHALQQHQQQQLERYGVLSFYEQQLGLWRARLASTEAIQSGSRDARTRPASDHAGRLAVHALWFVSHFVHTMLLPTLHGEHHVSNLVRSCKELMNTSIEPLVVGPVTLVEHAFKTLDNSPMAVAAVSSSGNCMYANDAFKEIADVKEPIRDFLGPIAASLRENPKTSIVSSLTTHDVHEAYSANAFFASSLVVLNRSYPPISARATLWNVRDLQVVFVFRAGQPIPSPPSPFLPPLLGM